MTIEKTTNYDERNYEKRKGEMGEGRKEWGEEINPEWMNPNGYGESNPSIELSLREYKWLFKKKKIDP